MVNFSPMVLSWPWDIYPCKTIHKTNRQRKLVENKISKENYLFESFAEKITWSFLTSYSSCAVHRNPLRHFLLRNIHLFFSASIWTIHLYLWKLIIWIRNLEVILHPRWKFPECGCTWINCSFELPNSSFISIAHINHHLKKCVNIKIRIKTCMLMQTPKLFTMPAYYKLQSQMQSPSMWSYKKWTLHISNATTTLYGHTMCLHFLLYL